MLTLLRKWYPIATNENIVTERTTDGARPAINANENKETRMRVSFINEPFRVLGIGLSKKVINNKI